MLLIQEDQENGVRMPKLAAFGSFAVNGVAEHEAELKGAVDALASAAVSGADRVAFAEVISSILDRDEYLVLADSSPSRPGGAGWDLIDRPREGHANEPLAG